MFHVVLTGFMASGKSAVGKRLARRLGYDFVDTDQTIEEKAGCTIPEIFARDGEAAFRRMEKDTIAALAPERPSVIATGGGTFVDADNRAALHKLGAVVCLVTSPEVILERVKRSDKRPLAQGPDAAERLLKLYESRLPFYRMADVMVETDGLTVDQAAQRVAAAIAPRLRIAAANRAIAPEGSCDAASEERRQRAPGARSEPTPEAESQPTPGGRSNPTPGGRNET
jgi:shikimate kinase